MTEGGTAGGLKRADKQGAGTKRVDYTFHFIDVWRAREELLWGAALTVRLSAISMVLSLAIAVVGALGRTAGPRWLRGLIAAYVEFIRNTPFLVQIFVIFFGLPAMNIRLDPNTGALIAMVLNGSAYTIEIVRAGIEAINHGQVEAAYALGLHRIQTFRKVVLPQALRAVFTPLGSQFILLMLNSSIVSVISADELTAAAQDIQSRTFRSFEVYITAIVMYLILSISFSFVFATLNRIFFPRLEKR
jgi:polar amino acid transport system permease protein